MNFLALTESSLTLNKNVGIRTPTTGRYIWTAFLQEACLLVILFLFCFSNMSHTQMVFRELFFNCWLNRRVPHDVAVASATSEHNENDALPHGCCSVGGTQLEGRSGSLSVLWQLCCGSPKL